MGEIMEDMKQHYQGIQNKWAQVYEQCNANPTACASHLNEIELDDIAVEPERAPAP